jgi:hypothetical protein
MLTALPAHLSASALALALLLPACERSTAPEGLSETETALGQQLEIERERLALERERLAFEREMAQRELALSQEALESAKGEQAKAEARARAAEAEKELAELNAREAVARAARETAEAEAKAAEAKAARIAPPTAPTPPPAPTRALPIHHQAPGYQPALDYGLFYEQLAPHGQWFQNADFGYVWQPEVALRSRQWRPYTHGRWLDTDRGWAWWSDEPFGWATYHYGRWAEVERVGWIWVPGPDWAPAWVSWRAGEEVLGWAPLPPVTVYETTLDYGPRTDLVCGIPPQHYTFVPMRSFVEPVPTHALPPARSATLVTQTTNVTRVVRREESIFVEGPRPEPLRRQFGERLPRHTVQPRTQWDPRASSAPAPRPGDGRVEYLAPRVAPVATTQAPARPSALAGILEQLLPTRSAAAPDASLLQRFTRERDRLATPVAPALAAPAPLSVPATRPTAAPPAAPKASTTPASPATPATGVKPAAAPVAAPVAAPKLPATPKAPSPATSKPSPPPPPASTTPPRPTAVTGKATAPDSKGGKGAKGAKAPAPMAPNQPRPTAPDTAGKKGAKASPSNPPRPVQAVPPKPQATEPSAPKAPVPTAPEPTAPPMPEVPTTSPKIPAPATPPPPSKPEPTEPTEPKKPSAKDPLPVPEPSQAPEPASDPEPQPDQPPKPE